MIAFDLSFSFMSMTSVLAIVFSAVYKDLDPNIGFSNTKIYTSSAIPKPFMTECRRKVRTIS